ncbi:hypothetical protein HYX06_02045 [Candidatus Woesearchaeota archaeon]|nr:hypothetical protein [Candidatus Woesearchaeota archaeon]
MGWLQSIISGERRLEQIEIEELQLLQAKSKSLRDLLQGIEGIMELAVQAKRDPKMHLALNSHARLIEKLELVEKNLKEELKLERDIRKKEESK